MYSYAEGQIRAGKTGLSLYEDTYIQVAEVSGSSWAAVAYVSRAEVLSELHDLTTIMIRVSVIGVFVLILLVVILTQ